MGKWDSYQNELSKLIQVGSEMLEKFNDHIRTTDQIPRAGSESERGHARYREDLRQLVETVAVRYQEWYTESYILIKQLLPDRLDEFEGLYSGMAGSPRMRLGRKCPVSDLEMRTGQNPCSPTKIFVQLRQSASTVAK